MNVLIIEDEKLAAERIALLLKQVDPATRIVATLESVGACLRFFQEQAEPVDLVLMDIHLADGSAFEIFQQVRIDIPIIFTTAYDDYAMDAFKVLSIDYLLKPITLEALTRSIGKMRLLQANSISQSPVENRSTATGIFLPPAATKASVTAVPTMRRPYKSRFLGRIGQKFAFVPATDTALFHAENRIVQLIAADNTRYLVDHTLEDLETMLDPTAFFRINRSIIVHAKAIESVRPFVNHRLRLFLKPPVRWDDIIVSRERVADFKKWADN
ncbi:MAG TPA: LytTR family DNA-binding domain-containing protein [Puia sp.]|uniref:LytR/AlgR family response regulator transcription factor n=1 Tax=Puia sp. TaxID=2045100 RepID=UPI002CFB4529|nr:LytTR family DNA-binding domain-containing protein [Puia sp.]HVU94871.1 LytTR family DNA-binding domain-containing protein [Puia sp.]